MVKFSQIWPHCFFCLKWTASAFGRFFHNNIFSSSNRRGFLKAAKAETSVATKTAAAKSSQPSFLLSLFLSLFRRFVLLLLLLLCRYLCTCYIQTFLSINFCKLKILWKYFLNFLCITWCISTKRFPTHSVFLSCIFTISINIISRVNNCFQLVLPMAGF